MDEKKPVKNYDDELWPSPFKKHCTECGSGLLGRDALHFLCVECKALPQFAHLCTDCGCPDVISHYRCRPCLVALPDRHRGGRRKIKPSTGRSP